MSASRQRLVARPWTTPGVDALLLTLAKSLAMAWVLHVGFRQVSDDDYARTVIAEQFAHAPRLDPSGTSWLPLPFWVHGALMMVFGRTLETARIVSFVVGAAAAVVPYLAMVGVGVPRRRAFVGAALVALTPWSVWMGAAPGPESYTGVLLGSAWILAGSRSPRAAWVAATLALVAALSRYEAWPTCALLAVVFAVRARRGGPRKVYLACIGIAVLGPASWMAWNAHAHGSPIHFLHRVAAFRQATGAAAIPLADKLLGYPRALLDAAPELLVPFVLGLPWLLRKGEVRARWGVPLLGAALTLAFLVYGDVNDGAPTHHAERALGALFVVLGGAGADALGALLADAVHGRSGREAAAAALAVLAMFLWIAFALERWPLAPGMGPTETREVQIARGRALRARGVTGFDVTPCQYEHFALIAAYGAPERVTIGPRSQAPITEACPAVVTR